MGELDDRHVTHVVRSLLRGAVTPFLGAGANLCGRPRDYAWNAGDGYFPSGAELAAHLAAEFELEPDRASDLMAVATTIELRYGRRPLYEELRRVFEREVRPTSLHELLARCPALVRERGRRAPLIVTTNYDNVLEHALTRTGEEFEVVAYVAEGEAAGKFRHYSPDFDEPQLIANPKRYDAIALERTTILKIHGTFDADDDLRDSYVISEDQYVEYLTTDVWDAIPLVLIARLRETHFLLLGYAMRDWNLMVVLKRLGLLPHQYSAWAIQLNPTPTEIRRWRNRDFNLLDIDLNEYAHALYEELERPRED